jgi:hypothetical protein
MVEGKDDSVVTTCLVSWYYDNPYSIPVKNHRWYACSQVRKGIY